MKKIYLILLLCFCALEGWSQTPWNRQSISSSLTKPALPSRGSYWGLGVRAGDPLGVTAKNYMGNNKALEISFGRPSGWWYHDGYYHDHFYDRDKYHRDKHHLYNWRNTYAIALQVHYLIHKDISGVPGLQWYFGVGGQLRMKGYRYDYREWVGTHYIYGTERATDFDLGPDGVIGLEYTFEDVPIALFVDATLFLEIVDNVYLYGQPGVGARWNF